MTKPVAFPARQAEPRQRFTWNDFRGTAEFAADDKGIVRPASELEDAACTAFGLPLATPTTKPAPVGKED